MMTTERDWKKKSKEIVGRVKVVWLEDQKWILK